MGTMIIMSNGIVTEYTVSHNHEKMRYKPKRHMDFPVHSFVFGMYNAYGLVTVITW